MPANPQNELVIGISSQALFDLREEEALLQSLGPKEFCEYQVAQEEIVLEPGAGFDLVRTLLNLNELEALGQKVSVVLMSPNNADSSLRLFRSIEFHNLDIRRVALTSGDALARYLDAFNIDLFLSTDAEEVRDAFHEGTAAAVVHPESEAPTISTDQIRIVLDSDTDLFSEESDRVYEEQGLEAFIQYEREKNQGPVPEGAFAKLFRAIAAVQAQFERGEEPIRTALISDQKSQKLERIIHAFRAWDVRLDEAFFLGGSPRKEILSAYQPHIVFGDDPESWENAAQSEPIVHSLPQQQDPTNKAA
jgi:5'-nucleotidase